MTFGLWFEPERAAAKSRAVAAHPDYYIPAGKQFLLDFSKPEAVSYITEVIAEQIKKYPLAKVESLFHLRLESGEMQFFDGSIDPRLFGHVVLMSPEGMIRIDEDIPMEKIVQVRREAKRKVFVTNALRALRRVAPGHELRNIPNVVLVGGSAEDFEIPEMLMEEFASWRIVCGRGNIRGVEGPRNAVATGLVLSSLGEGSV